MYIKEQLQAYAKEFEMDYFGVASVERFSGLPQGKRPEDIFTGAKSVIAMGKKIPQGPLTSHENAFAGKRIQILSFTIYCVNKINGELNTAAMKLAKRIENELGKTAVPIPAGEPHEEEKWMGVMSNRYAAYCAGLGEMVWSGFVATPEAGPRVMWVSLITDLELESDALYHGVKLCNREACSACIEACPVHALSREEEILIEVDGTQSYYGARNKPLCRCAVKGLVKGTPGRLQNDVPHNRDMKNMEDWYQLTKKDDPWQRMEFNHGNYCLRCMTQCPIGREGDKV